MSAFSSTGFQPFGIPGLPAAMAPQPKPCLLLIGEAQDDALNSDLTAQAFSRGWRQVAHCQGHAGEERTRREHLRALSEEYDRVRADAAAHALDAAPPVWVIATGYGAYLATLLSERRAIDRLLLRSPTVYPDAGWDLSKRELDAQRAHARHPIRWAPNDNQALRAAGQYLGQVWIVDSPAEEAAHHSMHVDYFHAFSRARERKLGSLGRGLSLTAPGATTAPADDDFRDTVAQWMAAQH